MRNLLALLALILIGFAAIGWYCEWYTFSVSKGNQGKPEIKTTVDTDKVADDSAAFFKRMGQLLGEQVKQTDKQDGTTPAKSPDGAAPLKGDPKSGGWLQSPSKPAAPSGSTNR